MSFFDRLLGRPEAAPKDTSGQIAEAIQKIQGVVELLEKKSEHLLKKMEKEKQLAKVHFSVEIYF